MNNRTSHINLMEECFRWFGPDDPVSLPHILQTGATGIVSALHHIYDGSVWPSEEIKAHKAQIENAGLKWRIVESIPIHNSIKSASVEREQYIEYYIKTMRSLAAADIKIICYNFMPVVDWTRTELSYQLPNGGYALRYDQLDFAAYDLFVLKRPNVEKDYSNEQIAQAEQRFKTLDDQSINRIERNLIAGLPASERKFDRNSFLEALSEYSDIDEQTLHNNLSYFLRQIIPVAEELGIRMCIHPDDPSFSLYGLPRIVSTPEDIRKILGAVDSLSNGLTFCTGSFGSNRNNDLVTFASEFASKIHFTHIRNICYEQHGSFYEADHLDGSIDLLSVILVLLKEQERRKKAGREDWQIPMRPDHGHLLMDDIGKDKINPGYSLIGRLKGLAEIRGVMHGINAVWNQG